MPCVSSFILIIYAFADIILVLKLIEFIGRFGGSHIDAFDSAGGYTSMFQVSSLPENCYPGHILLLSIGIHIKLVRLHSICFSGLQWHVGTTPTSPLGDIPLSHFLRISVVGYPSIASFEGDHLAFLGSIPSTRLKQRHKQDCVDKNAGEFRMSPEITGTV